MNDKLTDQELADALQKAIWNAKVLADHALERVCKYAGKDAGVAAVVPPVAGIISAMALAHSHATEAAIRMPGVSPKFGGK